MTCADSRYHHKVRLLLSRSLKPTFGGLTLDMSSSFEHYKVVSAYNFAAWHSLFGITPLSHIAFCMSAFVLADHVLPNHAQGAALHPEMGQALPQL